MHYLFPFSSGSVLLKKQQQLQQQTHHHHHQGPSNNLQQKQEAPQQQQQQYHQTNYQQQQYPSVTNSHPQINSLNNGSTNFASGISPPQHISSSTKSTSKNSPNNGNFGTAATNPQLQHIITQPAIQGKRVVPNRLETTMVSTTAMVVDQTPADAKLLPSTELNVSGTLLN